MNTPESTHHDAADDDQAPFAYDARLQAHFDEAARTPPAPPAGGWRQVQARLQTAAAPAPTARRNPLLRTAVASFVLGVLVMWGLQPGRFSEAVRGVTTTVPDATTTVPDANTTVPDVNTTVPDANTTVPDVNPTVPDVNPTVADVNPTVADVNPTVADVNPTVADVNPTVPDVNPTVPDVNTTVPDANTTVPDVAAPVAAPAVLAGLVLTETTFAAVPADSARPFRERRRAALLAQRAELTRLRWRTDSLLLGLGEGLASASVATDSLFPSYPQPLPPSRWSVALAFAPERNFFGLSSPVSDTLSALRRTHETGRAGYNASVLAEYRLDKRLSVGAGLGIASYGAELRLTDRQTHISTRLDSSITHSATVTTVIRHSHSIRTVRDSILAPILNANQQVIGYQYLPTTRLDTVWTHIENTQVDSVTKKTYTPIITTRQEVSARILRPNYRFLTVPLLVRYRLGGRRPEGRATAAERWWADVAVGAQLQFFLGGTQASTTDGRTYQTERVGPRGGPFRPFNVALTGAVAFNYALTPRLSASLAPTLRWQVESVYKASTNLTQKPMATGVQVGLKYAF